MNIRIIEAETEQLDDLVNLFDQYMVFYKKPSDVPRYKNYLKERLENNEAKVYIAYNEQNIPTGFVLNYFSFSSVSLGKIVVLNDLFVAKEYRKNGIAEKLIKSSFGLAKKIGAIRVDLGTAKDNFMAQKLYERIGFVQDEEFYTYSYNI